MASEVAFLTAVKTLTERNLTLAELIATADGIRAAGAPPLAAQLYQLWIQANQGSPLLYAAQFNYAVIATELGDLAGAKAALEQALVSNPDFFPAYINLGTVLERSGSLDQALVQWTTLVNRLPQVTGTAIRFKTAALKQIGRAFQALQQPGVLDVLKQSLDIDPKQAEVAEHYVNLRLGDCLWPAAASWEGVTRQDLVAGLGPLTMSIYTDDPILQLAAAWNYNRTVIGYPPGFAEIVDRRPSPAARRPGRLRIGYVSSDLRQHAIGSLMAELFEVHDRNTLEVSAYYCGVPQDDPMKARIKSAIEHWVDITDIDDQAAAARIAADGIDILVDVNGYTRDMRTRLFALRPAPVSVNWLGYPGTMGSLYHDYIIADDWIIPKEHEIYFSEKVMRLPCYQPNDRRRAVAAERPSRAAAGLPDDAMVYCCFNGLQKISRFTFDRWVTILQRVPGSVLWLLSGSDELTQRLRNYAAQRDVAPERLVFAPRMGNPQHLARYPLADLFVDTAPYGAHTTASDSLWMGVPILTLSGRGFASRVCGSLARAAGLPDLVCSTADEYVERAVALGSDRNQLQGYRARLAATRDTCVLFDTPLLARHLEGLYADMWREFSEGRVPRPDLTNLDVYHEVGIQDDHEAVEVQAIADYHGWYRRKLMQRHRLLPVGPDRRLWTPEDIRAAR
jgi:predicted O-linked N-acetylglucosamine transferase (SPINDLY family)